MTTIFSKSFIYIKQKNFKKSHRYNFIIYIIITLIVTTNKYINKFFAIF